MARHYAPRAVLRHLPLDLLRRFLDLEGIAAPPPWDALVEGDHRTVYQAWLDLPPGPRERVEQMLRQVHEMAHPAGVRALIAETSFRGFDVADHLDPVPGFHAKALWVLLNHPPAFHVARTLVSAAVTSGRYWNLTTGFGGLPFDPSPAAVQDLRLGVAALYREQGRGQRCTVERYERDGCQYLFVYLDDYTQTHVGHDDRGNLARYPLRPAFEVVFVYDPAAGTLDLYAQGDRRWRAALRDLFCDHIVHDHPPPARPDRRAYDLDGLIDRDFPLPGDPARGVEAGSVRCLRVKAKGSDRRVTLEANPRAGPGDVYDMLDAHLPADRFPRSELYVNLATFHVRYATPDHPGGSLTFTVSWPDACDLKSMSEERRAVGEECLRRWGILNDESADGTAQSDRAA